MMNHVVLVGRLTRAPEMRYTPSGIAVANFSLAVDRPFASADGKKECDFIEIVAWRKTAETCAEHLDKGRLVGVEGRLQIRAYEDKEGNKRKAAEVVANNVRFLDSPKKAEQPAPEAAPAPSDTDAPAEAEAEEIPF